MRHAFSVRSSAAFAESSRAPSGSSSSGSKSEAAPARGRRRSSSAEAAASPAGPTRAGRSRTAARVTEHSGGSGGAHLDQLPPRRRKAGHVRAHHVRRRPAAQRMTNAPLWSVTATALVEPSADTMAPVRGTPRSSTTRPSMLPDERDRHAPLLRVGHRAGGVRLGQRGLGPAHQAGHHRRADECEQAVHNLAFAARDCSRAPSAGRVRPGCSRPGRPHRGQPARLPAVTVNRTFSIFVLPVTLSTILISTR